MEMLDLDDSDDEDEDAEDEGEEGVIFNDSDGSVSDEEGGVDLFDDEDDAPSEIDELFEKELEIGQQDAEEKPETSRQKKKKMKSLPTFASAEDYAAMLDNDEDEDQGL